MLGARTILAAARFAGRLRLAQSQQHLAGDLFYDAFNCRSIVLGHGLFRELGIRDRGIGPVHIPTTLLSITLAGALHESGADGVDLVDSPAMPAAAKVRLQPRTRYLRS